MFAAIAFFILVLCCPVGLYFSPQIALWLGWPLNITQVFIMLGTIGVAFTEGWLYTSRKALQKKGPGK